MIVKQRIPKLNSGTFFYLRLERADYRRIVELAAVHTAGNKSELVRRILRGFFEGKTVLEVVE